MAFWDSASVHSNGTDGSLLHAQRDTASTDVSYTQTEVTGKWHPRTTLAFIVVTCSLLWGGIFLAVRFLF
jgi:hypothetical protein